MHQKFFLKLAKPCAPWAVMSQLVGFLWSEASLKDFATVLTKQRWPSYWRGTTVEQVRGWNVRSDPIGARPQLIMGQVMKLMRDDGFWCFLFHPFCLIWCCQVIHAAAPCWSTAALREGFRNPSHGNRPLRGEGGSPPPPFRFFFLLLLRKSPSARGVIICWLKICLKTVVFFCKKCNFLRNFFGFRPLWGGTPSFR